MEKGRPFEYKLTSYKQFKSDYRNGHKGPPNKRGLYRIVDKDRVIVYVGKGKIRERIRCHLNDNKKPIRPGYKICWHYAKEGTTED